MLQRNVGKGGQLAHMEGRGRWGPYGQIWTLRKNIEAHNDKGWLRLLTGLLSVRARHIFMLGCA
jgi:hypothetical protein